MRGQISRPIPSMADKEQLRPTKSVYTGSREVKVCVDLYVWSRSKSKTIDGAKNAANKIKYHDNYLNYSGRLQKQWLS